MCLFLGLCGLCVCVDRKIGKEEGGEVRDGKRRTERKRGKTWHGLGRQGQARLEYKISESITMGEVIWENKAKWSPILKYLLSGIKGTNLRL